MGGPIRAGCLGKEAEKTGKGTGRERIWHSAQRRRNGSMHLTANMASLFDFGAFLSVLECF